MRRLKFAIAASLLVASCAPGPDYVQPQFETPATYITQITSRAALTQLWWRGFEDPALNDVVQSALENNLNIEIAQARLEAALSGITAARSDFFPTLDGAVDGSASIDLGGGSDEAGDISFGGTITPDLNGRLRRQLEATRAIAARERYDVLDAQRIVAAATAQTYVNYKRNRARLQLLDRSLELQNQTLDIVKARRRAGLSAELDVQRAAADLARTRAQRGLLTLAQAQARYSLALLMGKGPSDFALMGDEETTVPAYVGEPFIGMSADVLRTRPDVLAAEADLIAATARIGIETADLYPSLSIPGSIGASLGEGGSVLSEGIALITATLDIPLLDAGRRRAEIRVAEAQAREALSAYEFALLDSLREIETALVSVQSFRDRQADLAVAVAASEAAFDQLNALYKEGLATFIDILDAQRTLIASREAYVDSEAALANAYISLYQVTGAPTQPSSEEAR